MSTPFLTALSCSWGAQSGCLLEQVIEGEIEKPLRFVVMSADPGKEDPRTYKYAAEMRQRCFEVGIDVISAPGPNLYRDLLNTRFNGETRIDNPPFWIRNKEGKLSKLKQKCTGVYKIAPMRRALRRYMAQKYSVTAKELRPGFVECWIGFAADEWHRCSESDVAYMVNRFPLIEQKLDKAKVAGWFLARGRSSPVRSVCQFCFANGIDYFKEMYETRPDDWAAVVEVDNTLETWKGRICDQEPFISSSLIRLRDLPAIGFGADRADLSEHHCNSGVCFL